MLSLVIKKASAKSIFIPLLSIGLMMVLNACGQKGPLYVPVDEPETLQTEPSEQPEVSRVDTRKGISE